MTFATDMQAAALDLISEFGQALTFTRYTMGSYSPATASLSVSSSAEYSGYGHPSPYKLDQIDGTLIQHNDVQLLVYSTTAPAQTDTVVLDSLTYVVMSVNKLNTQGSTVAYRLQLRK